MSDDRVEEVVLLGLSLLWLLFEQVLNGYAGEGKPGEIFDSFVIVADRD